MTDVPESTLNYLDMFLNLREFKDTQLKKITKKLKYRKLHTL